MVVPIRFSKSAVLQARKTAMQGATVRSPVQGLGSGFGLDNASKTILASVSSHMAGKALVRSDAIAARLQDEGGMTQKLAPGPIDQHVVSGLAPGSRGLTSGNRSNPIAAGLKTLGSSKGFREFQELGGGETTFWLRARQGLVSFWLPWRRPGSAGASLFGLFLFFPDVSEMRSCTFLPILSSETERT